MNEFINEESKEERQTPTEIIIKLVSWAYTMLVSTQYADNKPTQDLPDHLKRISDPLDRLINN